MARVALRGLRLPPWTEGSAHHLAARRRTAWYMWWSKPSRSQSYALVEVGAVGVGVGEVGGHEVAVAEVVEYVLCGGELVVGEGAEVEDGEGFDGGAYGRSRLSHHCCRFECHQCNEQ